MDHVKKLVYTIVGCLTIVSLTFTICTKIGHCAEDIQSPVTYDPLPFLYGNGLNYDNTIVTDSLVLQVTDDALTRFPNSYNQTVVNTVCSLTKDNYLVVYLLTSNEIQVDSSTFKSSGNGLFAFPSVNIDYRYAPQGYRYNLDGSFYDIVRTNNYQFRYYLVWYLQNGNYYYNDHPSTVSIWTYPVYVRYPELLVDQNGNQIFMKYGEEEEPVIPSGHTKGGVLANYIDSSQFLEDDSELPSVDVTPPSDPTSTPGWLQKILNGLGKINDSIKGGVLTIGDYIGMLKESVENAIAWLMEEPDNEIISDNIEPYLAQNDLISGFNSSKTAIQGVYTSVTNVTAKTRSQMVWDIPFNLPSMSQTFHAVIDFGWYENIRSTFEPFLNMFLCVGFLFSFIRSIPGILHGYSGEGDT